MAARGFNKVPMVGVRYGKLLVLADSPNSTRGARKVIVRCDCGTEKETWGKPLRQGTVVSCGCHKDANTIARSTKHGAARAPEYVVWRGMKQRCFDAGMVNYRFYGGLGVTVCDRWTHDFGAFLADMGSRPTPEHTIDRIDPFGNYEPSNCRWATRREQMNNLRKHHAPRS